MDSRDAKYSRWIRLGKGMAAWAVSYPATVATGRTDSRHIPLPVEAGLQRVKEKAPEGGRKAKQHVATA